jgi:hypothetical protein
MSTNTVALKLPETDKPVTTLVKGTNTYSTPDAELAALAISNPAEFPVMSDNDEIHQATAYGTTLVIKGSELKREALKAFRSRMGRMLDGIVEHKVQTIRNKSK